MSPKGNPSAQLRVDISVSELPVGSAGSPPGENLLRGGGVIEGRRQSVRGGRGEGRIGENCRQKRGEHRGNRGGERTERHKPSS